MIGQSMQATSTNQSEGLSECLVTSKDQRASFMLSH